MTQKISPEVFVSAARMASAMRSLSACEIIFTPHQLPDAPPPPNEPPPPEKPPPPENPPPPDQPPPPNPPEPDEPHGPKTTAPGPRRRTLLDIMRRITMVAMMIRMVIRKSGAPEGGSGRLAARCFHSS